MERNLRRLSSSEQAKIDQDLRKMGGDSQFQAEADQIDREFSQASWEAFQQGENELRDAQRSRTIRKKI